MARVATALSAEGRVNMDGKMCPNCYTFKPEAEFGKRIHNGKNILQPYCIECKRLLDRQYRRAKREMKGA